ncbi:KAP P-loop domain protein [Paludibacter propionicigenes WB4]|uniref:KAP P-loop domain protein n=1 Tax=Paludibacter propionicigenes (strain DSM 17365 / JCM 13257 / WB4) TaxID=694427 RepID=E4T2A4_PALPW|nr:P-loop NTPase fold protein [Paludibacter propionicigenes]ADQ78848.1 KAP P-loop domain protein [Paludibacter propionicigenes WB4]
MKLKHELEINKENPFKNCKLDRKKYAPALTNMLETFPNGFVMAIDNEWGTGKTTFVQMWKASIEKDYKTIYFNAWENDFDNDVLAALMGELGTLRSSGTETTFKEVVKKGAILSKNILPILIEAAANKYIGEGVVSKVAAELAKSSGEIMLEQVTEYTNKKKGLVEFRDSLAKYIEETKEGKPIVFIIDELDRCRPDYAVEVLEKVKHFFSVKGIVFVLSINKNELKNAIHGVYNSANINADDYLRRFIDIEYSIPEPDKEKFCNYLYSYYEFEDLVEYNRGHKEFLNLAYSLFSVNSTTLRQQEKIFAYARIVFNSFGNSLYQYCNEVGFILVYSKCIFPSFYTKLKQKHYSIQELYDELQKILPLPMSNQQRIISTESLLLFLYNGYYFYPNVPPNLLGDGETGLSINIDTKDLKEKFTNSLTWIHSDHSINDRYDLLKELFNYIDLINIS